MRKRSFLWLLVLLFALVVASGGCGGSGGDYWDIPGPEQPPQPEEPVDPETPAKSDETIVLLETDNIVTEDLVFNDGLLFIDGNWIRSTKWNDEQDRYRALPPAIVVIEKGALNLPYENRGSRANMTELVPGDLIVVTQNLGENEPGYCAFVETVIDDGKEQICYLRKPELNELIKSGNILLSTHVKPRDASNGFFAGIKDFWNRLTDDRVNYNALDFSAKTKPIEFRTDAEFSKINDLLGGKCIFQFNLRVGCVRIADDGWSFSKLRCS